VLRLAASFEALGLAPGERGALMMANRTEHWLAVRPDVLAAVGEAVAAANARLARVQQIKRWRLLPHEWTSATGELTPTLKLRRRVIHASYAGIIGELDQA
jgi:long-chain acyl-CoA synthetase